MIKTLMRKRLVTFLITLSVVSSAFYFPIIAPVPKAHAIFGFGDLVIDVSALASRVVDGAALVIAQQMIDQMVKSTINWAQSGFDGNPAYVTNPKQYFANIADGVAGEFIEGSDLSSLCSPFQTQIKLALKNQYLQENQFQCTLTDVIGNIEAFYDDFNSGGWDAWFSMTQNSSNNPYGAFLASQLELDARLAERLELERQELDWNGGFLSWQVCDKNHPSYIPPRVVSGVNIPESCAPETKVTQTPGTIIQGQLQEVLPSGLKKLQVAQHVDQLVSAFASGLLNRYVFGPKGLFNKDPNTDSSAKPQVPASDPCAAARTIYGNSLDENCNPISPTTNYELDGNDNNQNSL